MFPYWYLRPEYFWYPYACCTLERCKGCKYKKTCVHRKKLLKLTKEKVKFDRMSFCMFGGGNLFFYCTLKKCKTCNLKKGCAVRKELLKKEREQVDFTRITK